MDEDDIEVYLLPQSEANFRFGAAPQVERLLTIHKTLGGSGPGRRHNLEVLNKSAVVLTCAYWEAFIEDLAAEALEHLAEHSSSAQDVPQELQLSIAPELERQKHQLAMWQLADAQWRKLLRERADRITGVTDRSLSNPTSGKVDEFLSSQAGIVKVTDSWRWSSTTANAARRRLDEFVDLRNQIAHRGGPTDKVVLRRGAEKGLRLISRLTNACIMAVDQQLQAATGSPLTERL
jgi:RiboL-PSP-HEPN